MVNELGEGIFQQAENPGETPSLVAVEDPSPTMSHRFVGKAEYCVNPATYPHGVSRSGLKNGP